MSNIYQYKQNCFPWCFHQRKLESQELAVEEEQVVDLACFLLLSPLETKLVLINKTFAKSEY